MAAFQAPIQTHGETALACLEQLAATKPADGNEQLARVVQELVAMRDLLISHRRAGVPCDPWLTQTNALLSSIFGTEFPVQGLPWQRVCDTRDALRRMLSELKTA